VEIKRHIPVVGAALLSAALLVAAYPPFGETASIAVALAPLLAVARLATPKKAAWTWFGGGFAFWFATLAWMPAICKNNGPWPLGVLGWLGLAALCAGYFALFGWLDARAWRRFGRWGLAFEPILWAGVEWLRGWLENGKFAPAEAAGPYSSMDPLLPIKAFAAAHPGLAPALAMQAAAWAQVWPICMNRSLVPGGILCTSEGALPVSSSIKCRSRSRVWLRHW